MRNDNELIYSGLPEWPPNARAYISFPERWRQSVLDIIENDSVRQNEADTGITHYIGGAGLEQGLGPYYKSRIFWELMNFSEFEVPDTWDTTTAFITGGIGYDMAVSQIHCFDTSNIHPWSLELTGKGAYFDESGDMDIYVTAEALDFITRNYPHTKRKSRTVEGLILVEVEDEVDGKKLKYQFHHIENCNLSPIAQCALLAPTNLHQVGVAVRGPSLDIVDVSGSLSQGPWDQTPPMHLIDKDNPLKQNRSRVVGGVLIYGLMTPLLLKKYDPQFKEIRSYMEKNLRDMRSEEKEIILEKYVKWNSRIPYMDCEDFLDTVAGNLGKLGLMPFLLDTALELQKEDIVSSLLYKTLLYAKYIGMPEAMDIDDEMLFRTYKEHRSQLLDIAQKIDWQKYRA